MSNGERGEVMYKRIRGAFGAKGSRLRVGLVRGEVYVSGEDGSICCLEHHFANEDDAPVELVPTQSSDIVGVTLECPRLRCNSRANVRLMSD